MRSFLISLSLFSCALNCYAENLTLTNAEIAKLQHFFPTTENNQNDNPIEITPPITQENESVGSLVVSYVDLIRFAYQQLYAPERVLRHLSQYQRVPMQTEVFTSNIIYGDKVLAHPIASWRAGELYVTAVALQNKYNHLTPINVKTDLCGNWLAATIYPRVTLKSYGNKIDDSTTLFLVSRGTFSKTIGICYGNA